MLVDWVQTGVGEGAEGGWREHREVCEGCGGLGAQRGCKGEQGMKRQRGHVGGDTERHGGGAEGHRHVVNGHYR